MKVGRRQLLHFGGAVVALVSHARVWGQTFEAGPRAHQILRSDLEGQSQKVEETIASLVEFPPRTIVPWHTHPGAQELLFGLQGTVTALMEGQVAKTIRLGEIGLIAANVPHTVRNESIRQTAIVIVVHSRSDKNQPISIGVKER